MKRSIVSVLLALSPLVSQAHQSTVLDCENPQDGVEVNVCEAVTNAQSCEKAASEAVQLINQIRSGSKVIISDIKTIQEDEYYEVGFTYMEGDLILGTRYENKVYVSAGPKGCSVDAIKY